MTAWVVGRALAYLTRLVAVEFAVDYLLPAALVLAWLLLVRSGARRD